jgi:protein-tyrosine phosphatase
MQDGTAMENAADPALRRDWTPRRSRVRVVAGFAAAAAVAVAALELWYPIHQRFVPKQFGVVEPGRIYRSGQISASIIHATLVRYDIQTVVSLQDYDANDSKHRAEREATEALGIRELHFPLRGDGSGGIRSYASALAEMARADRDGAAVLVHCAAGTERTGATVAFYRILVQGRPASEAYRELQDGGWDPSDNPQLLVYMNKHMDELAQLLVEMDVIDRVPDPLPVMGP